MSMDSGAPPAAAAAGAGFSASAMARGLSAARAILGAWARAARCPSCLLAQRAPVGGSATAFIALGGCPWGCAAAGDPLLGAPGQGGGATGKALELCS